MAAQVVKIVTLAQARAFVAGGQEIAPGVYALKSQGITVTVRKQADGTVKLIIVQGCTC